MSGDLSLDPEWRKWAVEFGFPEGRVDQEFESFRDYWCGVSGKDGLKVDWRGTWRSRIRSAKDRLPTAKVTSRAPSTLTAKDIVAKPPSAFGKEVDDLLADHDWS